MSVNKHTDCCLKIIEVINKNPERIKNTAKIDFIIYLINNNICASNNAIEKAIREFKRLKYLDIQNGKIIIRSRNYEKVREQMLAFKSGIPDETELNKRLKNQYTVSREELSDIFFDYSNQELDQIITELQKKGFIKKLFGERTRGKYYVIRNNEDELFITNPIREIVGLFGNDLTFCYHTALQIHGLSRYAMSFEIFIETRVPAKLSELSQYKIKSVIHKANDAGKTKQAYGKDIIHVTDLERTLIDCIHKPRYAVGWENVAHAITSCDKVDPEKVLNYLMKIKIPSLYAKVGYVLELNKERWAIPSNYLYNLQLFKPRNPIGFFRDHPGKYNERWNMFIPENIMEV
jgi:predicted transcriptional regulator of viral defense system